MLFGTWVASTCLNDPSDFMETRLKNGSFILASVSLRPLLIIESVARVSQHVPFTDDLLVKQV